MKNPTNCHLWQTDHLTESDLNGCFAVVERLLDETHHIRSLLRCKECGQLYFYEFYEWVDFEHGNDPQYRTYIPVESPDEVEVLSKTTQFTILEFQPRLQFDWPKDAPKPKVYWVRGPETVQ